MPLKDIIVVLGSPNSDTGELGTIARDRLDHCISIYKPGRLVLCTGGWGEHFNTTEIAHAEYAKDYLINHGIPFDAFINGAYSANSVEDALKTKQAISGIDAKLIIITSDFHVTRIRLIFDEILNGYECNYIGVKNDLPDDELNRHIEHEKKAVAAILNNGLYY